MQNRDDPVLTHFLQHRGDMLRWLERFFGRRDLADEVAQETYLKFRHRYTTPMGSSEARRLFMTIARTTAIDHLRKERCQRNEPLDCTEDSAATPEDQEPFARMVEAQRNQLVRAAIDRLPPAHQLIMSMRYVQDLSREEIATYFEITVNAVEQRLTHARRRFHDELMQGLSGGPIE